MKDSQQAAVPNVREILFMLLLMTLLLAWAGLYFQQANELEAVRNQAASTAQAQVHTLPAEGPEEVATISRPSDWEVIDWGRRLHFDRDQPAVQPASVADPRQIGEYRQSFTKDKDGREIRLWTPLALAPLRLGNRK